MEESESGRRWVLIGILIGFYGNWYFNLTSRIEDTQNLLILIAWVFSVVSLFAYCTEIVSLRKSIWKGIRLGFVFAIIHLIAIGVIWTVVFSFSTVQFAGIILWGLISANETRMFYSQIRQTRYIT